MLLLAQLAHKRGATDQCIAASGPSLRAPESELTPAPALRARVPLGASLRSIESKLTPASALRAKVLCPA